MQRRRLGKLLWVMALLLGVLLATGAVAADPGLVARDVYAGGGPPVVAGDLRLVGTAGEAVVAPVTTTGDVQQGAGFWAKVPVNGKIYLPMIAR